MIETLRRLFCFLDGRMRLGMLYLLLSALAISFLETVGVGLFLPLLQGVVSPDKLQQFPFVGPWLYDFFLNASPAALTFAGALIFLFFAAKNGLIFLLIFLQKRFVTFSESRFRAKVFASYLRRPYVDSLQINSTEVSRDLMRSVPQMFNKVLMPLIELVMESLIAMGALIALLLVEPLGSIIAVVILGAVLFSFYWFSQRKLAAWGRVLEESSTRMFRWISEGLGSLKETKVLARESFFEKSFQSASLEFAGTSYVVASIYQVPRLLGEVTILGVLFLIIGLAATRQGSIISALPVLGVFAAASLRLLPSLSRIVQSFATIRQSGVSVNYVHNQFGSLKQLEKLASIPLPRADGDFQFDQQISVVDLNFRYPGAQSNALTGLNFVIHKGETLAVVGPSGSGKTTLADLLLGLLAPSQGRIEVDNKDIALDLAAWRKRIGFVSQNTHIFDDTLPRNIAFGVPDNEIDLEKVREALRMTRLDSSILDAFGFDKPVGEYGKRLSGGQRQRLGIARALYESPSFLILDEATSALDNVTEHEVTQSIFDVTQGKTMMIIAHRLTTVMRADRLLYLEAGRIIADGSYDQLLETCPPFRRQVEIGTFNEAAPT